MTVAWDLDGTLLCYPDHRREDVAYDDPDWIREHAHAEPIAVNICRAIGAGPDDEHGVAYVTGRVRDVLEDVTREQLAELNLPAGPVRMQPEWTGYEPMVDWKAEQLEALDAEVYIGDTQHDRHAAEQADVAYLDVGALRILNLHI